MANKGCTICGAIWHTQTFCPRKPHKPIARSTKPLKRSTKRIRPVSVGAGQSLSAMKRRWDKANPPDEHGGWKCYLHISPNCPGRVTPETLTYEHVVPRWKSRTLKFDEANIQPACSPCNALKGSRVLEDLVAEFPHLREYL